MARNRCGCSGGACGCLLEGGNGIDVTGSGTIDDPYIIDGTGQIDISTAVRFVDTDTVDFTTVGSGTSNDPYVISADANLAVEELTDVSCASPSPNDVLAWDGTSWVCAPPSTAPVGEITTTHGASGDGTAASPIQVDTVAEFGSPPLDVYTHDVDTGHPVYVDETNVLRIPRGEGPYRLQGPSQIAAAGWAATSGAVIRDNTQVIFGRSGDQVTIYWNSLVYDVSGRQAGGARRSGNLQNVQVVSGPGNFRPLLTVPAPPAATGRGHFTLFGGTRLEDGSIGVKLQMCAIVPNSDGTTVSGDNVWSFNWTYTVHPSIDPYSVLADVRALVPPEQEDPIDATPDPYREVDRDFMGGGF